MSDYSFLDNIDLSNKKVLIAECQEFGMDNIGVALTNKIDVTLLSSDREFLQLYKSRPAYVSILHYGAVERSDMYFTAENYNVIILLGHIDKRQDLYVSLPAILKAVNKILSPGGMFIFDTSILQEDNVADALSKYLIGDYTISGNNYIFIKRS